jgi:mono/diheme cytochrome c family protein
MLRRSRVEEASVIRCFSHRRPEKLMPTQEEHNRGLCLVIAAPFLALMALLALPILAQPRAAAQGQEPPSKAEASPAGNAPNGKRLFASHGCSTCHGSEAQGAVGPRIGPPPVPFGTFVSFVRQPAGQMPPFTTAAVSNSELADIYAFLQSVPGRASAVTSLTGNADKGKRLFTSYGCYECHGYLGQGSTQTGGARIGPPAISLQAVVEYVRHPTGQMPPYSDRVVSDQDLADIYAYLKSQPQPPPAKDIPLLNQ